MQKLLKDMHPKTNSKMEAPIDVARTPWHLVRTTGIYGDVPWYRSISKGVVQVDCAKNDSESRPVDSGRGGAQFQHQ